MLLKNPEQNFEEIYAIYEASFPEVERRTKEGQRAAMNHPRMKVRAARKDGRIAAFLTGWELENCIYLEHLATDPACRGGGLGKGLILESIQEAKEKQLPLILEIEPVTEEKPDTVRRAAFYERLGFVINRFPYEQPPLREGASGCPLWIVTYGKPMGEEEFLPYKRQIFHYVYGCSLQQF